MSASALLVAALVASQIQTHPTGLKAVGLSHGRRGVRTVQILDKLYEQAGKPSFDLDLARFKDLHDNATGETSLVSFTRSSMGTYVGSDGLIKRSAVNLALYSEQFDNAAWAKINVTVSANQIVSPDGKQTADKISETATTDFHRVDDTATVSTGATYTLSAYFKAGERNRLLIRTFDGSANISIACKDDGTIASIEGTPLASSNEDAGNGWRRCSMTYTVASGATGYLRFGPIDSGSSASYAGTAGHGIYLYGAQLEEGTTATPYIRTTSTVSGAPRFDHDPVTGESLGLLVEEARTNLVARSNDLLAEGFAELTGAGPTANFRYWQADQGTGPDGTTTFAKLIESNNLDQQRIFKGYSVTSGTSYTWSGFFKAAERIYVGLRTTSGTIHFFNLSNGTIVSNPSGTAKIVDYGNGIYRCSFTFTAASTMEVTWVSLSQDGITDAYTGDGSSGIFAGYFQLEAGSFPTSYIPTTTSTVTRAADIAAVQDADFSTTNLLAYSEAFTSWGDTNISRDSATETAPDGQATALQISASSANGTVIYPAAMGTSAERVFSIYLRRVTGTGDIQYTLDNGSNWTTQAITSTWQRYIFPKTTAAQRPGIRIVTSGDAIEMWGASLTATEYPVAYTTTRNLLTDSQDFERSTWVKVNGSLVDDDVTQAPDGTMTADRIRKTTTSLQAIRQNTITVPGVVVESVYAKKDSTDNISFTGGAAAELNISLVDGSILANSGTFSNVSVSSVGNGWFRISYTRNASSGVQPLYMWPTNQTGLTFATFGAPTASAYIWGAQLEPGTVATDYVRTVDTVGKAYRWYEPTEGTLYGEQNRLTNTDNAIFSMFIGTSGNDSIQLRSYQANNARFSIFTSGATQMDQGFGAPLPLGTPSSHAISYRYNDANASVNGKIGTLDTSVILPIVNQLEIRRELVVKYNGHIKRLTYWPQRKPDATLQVITQ